MKKILFVCLGNICRSPMAEFVLRDMLEKSGLSGRVIVASAATSDEEVGNPVHPGTRRKLSACGVPMDASKRATQLTRADYQEYDLIIGMDSGNLAAMRRLFGGDPEKKIFRLLDFTDAPGDIADPWYTGNFDQTYDDVLAGCKALLKRLNA